MFEVRRLGESLNTKRVLPVIQGLLDNNYEGGFNLALSLNNFRWVIRDGRSALFWEDHWEGPDKLRYSFPRLTRYPNLHTFQSSHFVVSGQTLQLSFIFYGVGS